MSKVVSAIGSIFAPPTPKAPAINAVPATDTYAQRNAARRAEGGYGYTTQNGPDQFGMDSKKRRGGSADANMNYGRSGLGPVGGIY